MAERMDMADLMARLQTVVAAYGADSARWPAAERQALSAFAEANVDARGLCGEEAAFDAVLAAAAADAPAAHVGRARDGLFARLDAEAGAAVAPAAGGTVLPFGRRPAPRPAALPPRHLWREASVLAAALLIGIFTGAQGVVEGSGLDLTALTRTAGTTTADGEDISALALGLSGEGLSEEDLL